jgi:LysR family nod box-dependent transcriptional activator
MRFNRLDLNLLVALDALLVERNITRASRRLNLSQSATSGVLARLREALDDEILVQVGRSMVPTPFAESLVKPVRDVLLQIQATFEARPAFDPSASARHFRVAASNYPTTVLLTPYSQQLSWSAPDVTVEILPLGMDFTERLDRAEVDLLIMPAKYLSEDHPQQVLFEETYKCVVWAGNTEVGATLSMEQFLEMSHIASSFGDGRQLTMDQWFLQTTGVARRVGITTNDFNTVPGMVMNTNRIATMHARLAEHFGRYFPLRLLEPPIALPSVTMAMQWHKYLDKDPGHRWFREGLCQLASADGISAPEAPVSAGLPCAA